MEDLNCILKSPKGTRDLNPNEVRLREKLFESIKKYFELYGGQPIDTPVIECVDTVKNLYGDEFNKLVYTLDDQGGEKLLLRYDLTVPFARYIVNNAINIFKRYQIGKVYRRDEPQITKGRFREFYQADFDIIGTDYETYIQDTEMLLLLTDILKEILGDQTFIITFNNRNLLFDVLSFIGVDKGDYNKVCSSLDKLDKKELDEVIDELIKEKQIDVNIVNKLTNYITLVKSFENSDLDTIEKLNILLEKGYIQKDTFDSMIKFINNINSVQISKYINFNPLLSRGLDYYTGIIYEAIYCDQSIMSSTIAAGGRYDNMLDRLGNRGIIPAIGLSIGIERIVTILEKTQASEINTMKDYVYVATVGKNMETHKLVLINELRKQNINVEYSYNNKAKMRQQFEYVFKNGIKYMIILGENEVNTNTLKLKFIEDCKEITINRNDLLTYIR